MATSKSTGMEEAARPTIDTLDPDALAHLVDVALGVSRLLSQMAMDSEEQHDMPQAGACELMANALWDAVKEIVGEPLHVGSSNIR